MRKEIDQLLKNYAVDDARATAQLSFPESFTGFKGHFPQQPVLPGVCQMMLVMVMAERMAGKKVKMSSVTNAKFVSVVVPDQLLEISCTLADGVLKASLLSGGNRVSEFKLKVEDA